MAAGMAPGGIGIPGGTFTPGCHPMTICTAHLAGAFTHLSTLAVITRCRSIGVTIMAIPIAFGMGDTSVVLPEAFMAALAGKSASSAEQNQNRGSISAFAHRASFRSKFHPGVRVLYSCR